MKNKHPKMGQALRPSSNKFTQPNVQKSNRKLFNSDTQKIRSFWAFIVIKKIINKTVLLSVLKFIV